jgi:DNA-binding NtrC family response regulator
MARSKPIEEVVLNPVLEPKPISLDARLRAVEARLIEWALKQTRGNKSKAAALLGIKRSTLGDRINRVGLGKPAGPRVARSPETPEHVG